MTCGGVLIRDPKHDDPNAYDRTTMIARLQVATNLEGNRWWG